MSSTAVPKNKPDALIGKIYASHRLGEVAEVVETERDASGGSGRPRHEEEALHAAGVDEVVREALVAEEDGEQSERVERESHVVPRARVERERDGRLHLCVLARLDRGHTCTCTHTRSCTRRGRVADGAADDREVRAYGARTGHLEIGGRLMSRTQVDVVEDEAQDVSLEEDGQQLDIRQANAN